MFTQVIGKAYARAMKLVCETPQGSYVTHRLSGCVLAQTFNLWHSRVIAMPFLQDGGRKGRRKERKEESREGGRKGWRTEGAEEGS